MNTIIILIYELYFNVVWSPRWWIFHLQYFVLDGCIDRYFADESDEDENSLQEVEKAERQSGLVENIDAIVFIFYIGGDHVNYPGNACNISDE